MARTSSISATAAVPTPPEVPAMTTSTVTGPTVLELPAIALFRLPQVLKVIPVSRTTWWRGIKEGRFPRPVRLGPRSVAWRASDIQALIASLPSAARQASLVVALACAAVHLLRAA
jgi:predicted DNA-binding transcriptional regulator AlpA